MVLHECPQRAAPAAGYGWGAKRVFQNQIPADDPGNQLAERGIAISIGGTGDGNHRSEFRITEAGEHATSPCKYIREHDGWAGIKRRCRTSQHKNARADNGRDPQGDQVYRSQRALETVLSGVARFLHQYVERLGCKQGVAHATPPLGVSPDSCRTTKLDLSIVGAQHVAPLQENSVILCGQLANCGATTKPTTSRPATLSEQAPSLCPPSMSDTPEAPA